MAGGICFTIGLLYEWYLWQQTLQNQTVVFGDWLFSQDAIKLYIAAISDLGISLIGSAVFLVGVDRVIDQAESKKQQEAQIQQKRFIIASEMRTNPQKALELIRISGEIKVGYFTNQFFGGCDFSGLNFDSADFTGSNLTNVNFENASLIGVNFHKCIMTGADVHNCNLSFANFLNTDISEEALKKANRLWQATLPNGQVYDGRFMLAGDAQEAQKYGFDIVNSVTDRKLFFNKKQ